MHLYECSCMYVYICICMEEEEGMHTYVHTRICTHIICVHMAVEEKEAQYIYAYTLYAWKHMYPHYLDEHTCMQTVWCTWLWMCVCILPISATVPYIYGIYMYVQWKRERATVPHMYISAIVPYMYGYICLQRMRERARGGDLRVYMYMCIHTGGGCAYI